MPKPTITIIGGGISGLTLAAALHHRQIPIHLYESAPSFTEIGLGVSFSPAAYRILPLLNPNLNLNTLITTPADTNPSHLQTWFEIVWAAGPNEDETLMTLTAPPTGQTALRRADFLNALARLIPAECVHFGKRLEKLESGGVLRFEDGEVVFADVVIGCDGIRSRVREAIVPSVKPVYSGMYGYRGVIGMGDMIEAVGKGRACVSTIYVSRGAYAVSYPIMKGRFVNVGIYVFSSAWEYEGWVRPGRREDLVRDTRGMGRFVRAFVEYMTDASQWGIFEHPHIETYARSRIAIMGDAAHASTPHQGAGAGQAIEDAHVLAELLGDSRVGSVGDVIAAFRAYDEIRRPRCQRVVTSSKENADVFCLGFDGVWDDPVKLKEMLDVRFRWLWDLDVQDQVERARERMREYLEKQRAVED